MKLFSLFGGARRGGGAARGKADRKWDLCVQAVSGVCVCVVVVCVNNQGFNVFVFFLFLNGLLDSC